MKKILFIALALLLAGQVAFADTQLDSGTQHGQTGANNVYFIARNARVGQISADRVVIWDTTSNDGISVTTTTTSYDALVAGVTMDAIPGITSDATAATQGGYTFNNWGRVQVYGRHANVSFDPCGTTIAAGSKVAAHSTAGLATAWRKITHDELATTASGDSFGVALEAVAAGTKDLDIFIQRM